MKKTVFFLLAIWLGTNPLFTQDMLPDSCKLSFGVNLSGISDWMTEMPLVDLMHQAREWYTKDIGNVDDPWLWDSQHAHELAYRPDGYPTHIPQILIPGPSSDISLT